MKNQPTNNATPLPTMNSVLKNVRVPSDINRPLSSHTRPAFQIERLHRVPLLQTRAQVLQCGTNPLFHHGMVIVGVPYSVPQLISTTMGGTPYGPSHVSGYPPTAPISEDEAAICRALGERMAQVARKLSA